MINALKAEFLKVLTVRSTYVIFGICLAILMLFTFFDEGGYRSAVAITDSNKLNSLITGAILSLGVIISLIGLLLMTHEYRYNTILYTLVTARDRLKVLLAKIIVVSVVALVFTLIFATLAPLLTYAGLQLRGVDMVPQNLPSADLVWRVLFFGWGYSMIALLIAALVRSQVGAIALLLLFPATVETVLGLILKENAVYLPFNALSSVLLETPLEHTRAALVFLAYLIVGWLVAALLFKRRDAS